MSETNADRWASLIEREADKYESNSSPGANPNATPERVALEEKWDAGWLAGMRDAAALLRRQAPRNAEYGAALNAAKRYRDLRDSPVEHSSWCEYLQRNPPIQPDCDGRSGCGAIRRHYSDLADLAEEAVLALVAQIDSPGAAS